MLRHRSGLMYLRRQKWKIGGWRRRESCMFEKLQSLTEPEGIAHTLNKLMRIEKEHESVTREDLKHVDWMVRRPVFPSKAKILIGY
ncbi:hypothetical protein ISN44_As05g004320, partial [Arabidopsis suecica]|uniref:Uncharacterized protein n=3 Tax=Arabidopsis TaxID=3701 RepID=B3H6G1_ARATH|eukprot:NP_001119172.1 hypothetical protein AT5G05113 [Arabidopsis thaliana]